VARVKVSTIIAAPPEVVWEELRHIERHVDWMADAEAIRFTSVRRQGVGTTFDCDTRIGPIRLVDRMEITAWEPEHTMGVRHVGLVTGTGAFALRAAGPGATTMTWTEELRFPWWLGGPMGAWVARPVLARIWRGNLRRLRERVVSRAGGTPDR
jgi:Polyketide cyclase / dehydrase and lipid transport